jgi:hypothetical protein
LEERVMKSQEMLRSFVVMVVGSLLVLTVGCGGGDETGEPNGNTNGEGGTIEVSVTGGATPTYSWDGGPAISVIVQRDESTDEVWGVTSSVPGEDVITSPLEHGTVPPDCVEVGEGVLELTEGVDYMVVVTRADESFGWTKFTP